MKKLLLVSAILLLVGCQAVTEDLKMGTVYEAAHGDRAFAVATVVLEDDKIIEAYIDEFQFLAIGEGVVCAPSSNGTFGTSVEDGKCLASKKINNESYSESMKTNGGATQDIKVSYEEIEKYVIGKTIEELEEVVFDVDTIAGSTLEDNEGYVNALITAAKAAK